MVGVRAPIAHGSPVHARKRRQEWREIVRAFERSGRTHEAFCVARRLNLGSFRAWLYRIRREGPADVRLVPVRVHGRAASVRMGAPTAATAVPPSPIVLVVGDVELRVPPGCDPAYVAALVAQLGRC